MITVILNGYKRGHVLETQYNSVVNQTMKPSEIILWQNKGQNFDPDLTEKMTHVKSNKNFGVWARFAMALNAETEYICVFDDDTIPGSKWLENCYNTIQKYDGLLGTIGVTFLSKNSYQPIERVGWANPNHTTHQVDIVGHSWFFRREWLSSFWRELPSIGTSRIVGEDIHFSYTLQKYLNKNTYVPPHPIEDPQLWGSDPRLAWSIGTDNNAISVNNTNLSIMNETYKSYINKGFKTIKAK